MKRLARFFALALAAATLLLAAPASQAATPAKASAANPPPGIAAAQTLSQVTGIAISPLLGVGTVGAWKYFHTDAKDRASLSWYAQPWFWGPALLVVLMCFAKDSLGPVIPTALKKPFDIAEVFENKLSGLVATGAIVPMAMEVFRAVQPESASLAGAGMAAIDLSPLWNILMVPIALIAYGVVFLVSHTINILILISPFATVDAALKSFRLFLLSTVAGTSFANEKYGAIWAALIVIACLPLAGWAFRLFIFGHVFAWDFLTLRRKRFQPTADNNRAFLARKISGVPGRSYGSFRPAEGGALEFTYRPWLVLPARRLTLPAGELAVGRGLFHPEVVRVQGDDTETLLNLPPRYRGHEEAAARLCGARSVRDVGLRAAWSWFKSLFGFGPAAATA